MDDKATLTELLAAGWAVYGRPVEASRVFPQENPGVYMITLAFPGTAKLKRIFTNSNDDIAIALDENRNGNKPIGTLIEATCVVAGGRTSEQSIFRVDGLVPSLDGLFDWKFEAVPAEIGKFKIRIKCPEGVDTLKYHDKLHRFLRQFSLMREIGIHIEHLVEVPILRVPFGYVGGVEECMLPPLTPEEKTTLAAGKLSDAAFTAAIGLTCAWMEYYPPSRVGLLWATMERVFGKKGQRLLSDAQLKDIVDALGGVKSIVKKSDGQWKADDPEPPDYLGKIKSALCQLELRHRNERMAAGVARVLNITEQEALTLIRVASSLRGKHLHTLQDQAEWVELREAEVVMQRALVAYLKEQRALQTLPAGQEPEQSNPAMV